MIRTTAGATIRRGGAWRALRPLLLERSTASWLAERGSLTRRLRAECEHFELVLLRQVCARPLPDEAALLRLRPGQRAWVREVLLVADGRPVVYAHSVARAPSLRTAWRPLSRLGARSMGDAIFEQREVQRGPIRVRHLRPGERLHRAASLAAARAPEALPALWARRSPFIHAAQALWITEVFLPPIAALRAPRGGTTGVARAEAP
jgi:chorismate--pyruvate lyase